MKSIRTAQAECEKHAIVDNDKRAFREIGKIKKALGYQHANCCLWCDNISEHVANFCILHAFWVSYYDVCKDYIRIAADPIKEDDHD